jgi:hypothetical protein
MIIVGGNIGFFHVDLIHEERLVEISDSALVIGDVSGRIGVISHCTLHFGTDVTSDGRRNHAESHAFTLAQLTDFGKIVLGDSGEPHILFLR